MLALHPFSRAVRQRVQAARNDCLQAGLAPVEREAASQLARYLDLPRLPPDRRAALAAHTTGVLADVLALANPEECEAYRQTLAAWGALPEHQPFASPHSRVRFFLQHRHEAPWPYFDDTRFEVTVLCGLPASGKDTWLRLYRPGLEVISLDALRSLTGVAPDDAATRLVALRLLRESLRAQQPVAWNSTLVERRQRRALVELCVRYGARIHLVHVEAP